MRTIVVMEDGQIVGAIVANDEDAASIEAQLRAANRHGQFVIHNVIAESAADVIGFVEADSNTLDEEK